MLNFSDEILRLIDQLAARLQKPAAAVWEIAYRQAIVDGITAAFTAVVSLACFLFTIYACFRWKEFFWDFDYEIPQPWILLVIFVLFVTGCVFVFQTPNAIAHFVNPGYYAIENLRAMLK